MRIFRLVSTVVAMLASAAAFAQSANYTSVETAAGIATRIGYYASAKKDCAPAPLPTIRVIGSQLISTRLLPFVPAAALGSTVVAMVIIPYVGRTETPPGGCS